MQAEEEADELDFGVGGGTAEDDGGQRRASERQIWGERERREEREMWGERDVRRERLTGASGTADDGGGRRFVGGELGFWERLEKWRFLGRGKMGETDTQSGI